MPTIIYDDPELSLSSESKTGFTDIRNLVEFLSQCLHFFGEALWSFSNTVQGKRVIFEGNDLWVHLFCLLAILQLWCIKLIKEPIYQRRKHLFQLSKETFRSREINWVSSYTSRRLFTLFSPPFHKRAIIKKCHEKLWNITNALTAKVFTFRESLPTTLSS